MTKRKNLITVPKPPAPVEGKNGNGNDARLLLARQELYKFKGPLPHPDILKAYETISPGFANRIVEMAENETRHRHACENKALDADIGFNHKVFAEARIGQVFAFLIGITAIVSGSYAAVHGAGFTGAFIGGGGVIGLVAVFIMGRKMPPKEE